MNTYLASSNLSKWRQRQRNGGSGAGGDRHPPGRGGGVVICGLPPGGNGGFSGRADGGDKCFPPACVQGVGFTNHGFWANLCC